MENMHMIIKGKTGVREGEIRRLELIHYYI